MPLRMSRFVFAFIVILIVSLVSLGVPPAEGPKRRVGPGYQVVRAACFAWGVNGAPNSNNAPDAICQQCAALSQCVATDGTNFFCGSCGPVGPTDTPVPPPPPSAPSLSV